MIVYNNQEPTTVNNVGQFGATEGSIGAYKQAAEYAADAKYWALLAEAKFGTVDDLIAEVEKLYQQGVLLREDIEALKQDFRDQDARLMQLISQSNAAVANANNAIALINQKLVEVDKQLDILLGMTVEVTTLSPGQPATGDFDPTTGKISLGIPEGLPGKDGSVKDLSTAPDGVPVIGDLGFYVDQTDNTVHKTTLENIANLIPSVRDIRVNGGPAETGNVALTIDKIVVGLGNVENVASYSKEETDKKVDRFIKAYNTKADADADAINRKAGETILVWEDTKYSFYTVASDKILEPLKTEPRVVTVNSRIPDSTGNIDITIPTGNPSLYLGEMVMFPYDPAKNISYPGILPADGRLVSKESAADLGPSLVSGQLPVVSETEWQAGSRQYFSWGKQADGITDADSTNYVNIRLPDWTGGEAIRSPNVATDTGYKGQAQAQKPYIVTVNNLTPNDSTGNVQLTASTVGALAKSGDIIDGNLVLNKTANLRRIKNDSTQIQVVGRSSGDATVFGDSSTEVIIQAADIPKFYDPTSDYKFYTEKNPPTNVEVGAAGVTSEGVNSDLKTLTQKVTFQQPVTIPDAVGDYDAVTYRQLKNQGGGGSGGPTMNGISNFNIGDFRLIDSRAFIHANDIPADGQLLSRTDYPELWAYAQMLTPIPDAEWVETPENRGKYSLGDGSTTFRVPDRNGILKQGVGGFTGPNSITALYARGDAGDSAINGTVSASGVPNITGSITINTDGNTLGLIGGGTGAFSVGEQSAKAVASNTTTTGAANRARVVDFNARLLSDIYGRTTTEVRTNSFFGVWVIRAKGAFIAANTSWSVINSDTTKPSNGTTVVGGSVISQYTAESIEIGSTTLNHSATLGSTHRAILSVKNKENSTGTDFQFLDNGTLGGVVHMTLKQAVLRPTDVESNIALNVIGRERNDMSLWTPNTTMANNTHVNRLQGYWYDDVWSIGGLRASNTTLAAASIQVTSTGGSNYWTFNRVGGAISTANGSITPVTSDERLKEDIVVWDESDSLNKVKSLVPKSFTWKADGRKDLGFIAQDLQKVNPLYTWVDELDSQNDRKLLNVSDRAIMADMVGAIKALSAKVEELEAKLAAK